MIISLMNLKKMRKKEKKKKEKRYAKRGEETAREKMVHSVT